MEVFAAQIAYVALWSPAVVLGFGVLRLGSRSPAQRLWLLQLALAMAAQLIGLDFAQREISNLPVYHVHILLEFNLYVWVMHLGMRVGFPQVGAVVLSAAFSVFWLLNASLGEGLWEVPTIAVSVESILLSGLVLLYFFQTFRASRIMYLEREFLFWFSLGILILFLGNILIALFLGPLTEREDVYFHIWTIRSCTIILTNLIFIIAILCRDPQTKS
jgi:hypothetical protein